jgi:hypothetical protein
VSPRPSPAVALIAFAFATKLNPRTPRRLFRSVSPTKPSPTVVPVVVLPPRPGSSLSSRRKRGIKKSQSTTRSTSFGGRSGRSGMHGCSCSQPSSSKQHFKSQKNGFLFTTGCGRLLGNAGWLDATGATKIHRDCYLSFILGFLPFPPFIVFALLVFLVFSSSVL